MKSKIIALVAFSTLALLVYCGYAFYQIKHAHPYKLIYASTYGNWEYHDSRLLPLPFRHSLTLRELKERPLPSYDEWPSFELMPYTILALTDSDKYEESKYQGKLESLVDIFLDKGLDIDQKSSNGCTSLQLMALDSNMAAIDYLKSKRASMLEHLESQHESVCSMNVSSLMNKFTKDID